MTYAAPGRAPSQAFREPATALERKHVAALVRWAKAWVRQPGLDGDPDLVTDGPEFHRACWLAAMHIRAGTTMTYAQLAAQAGRPRAVRAAAQAMATNRWAPMVPCHRVVSASGLGGFMNRGESVSRAAWPHRLKAWLLEREGCTTQRR